MNMLNNLIITDNPKFFTLGVACYFKTQLINWKLPTDFTLPDVAILHVSTLVTTATVAFDTNFANLTITITLPHGSVRQVYRVPRHLVDFVGIIITGAGQATRKYRLNLLTRNTVVVTHNEYLHINNLMILPLKIYNIFILMSTFFYFPSTNYNITIIKNS